MEFRFESDRGEQADNGEYCETIRTKPLLNGPFAVVANGGYQ